MKRLLAAVVALLFVLGIGTFSAGAEDTVVTDTTSDGEQGTEVELTLYFSLKEDSLTLEELNEQLEDIPPLKTAYENSQVNVKVGLTVNNSYSMSFENNKGVVKCYVTIPSGLSKVNVVVELVSSTFNSGDARNVSVFENITQTIEVFADGETSRSYEIKHGWASVLTRLYDSIKRGAELGEVINILVEEGVTFETSQNLIDRVMNGIANYLGRFTITANLFTSDGQFGSEQLNGVISTTFNVIYPTAFLLMCVIWLISIGKSSVSTDLWQKESYIKPLLRLLWGVGMMSFGLPLLELIFVVFHRISMEAFGADIGTAESLFDTLLEESREWVDDSWIVGGIMTFINLIINLPKILIYAVIEIIFGIVFYVIVAIRFIKLATMQCISPFFFACSVSEKTEKYLQSFIREYIVAASQMLVAMIMYSVLTAMYTSALITWEVLGLVLGLIMYLAGIIAVAGSGKFIRNLFT